MYRTRGPGAWRADGGIFCVDPCLRPRYEKRSELISATLRLAMNLPIEASTHTTLLCTHGENGDGRGDVVVTGGPIGIGACTGRTY